MIPRHLSTLTSIILRGLATAMFARGLSEEILYWHRSRLYWEGVTHPDGGHQEDQANVELADGAIIAVGRIADRLGIGPHSLPDTEMARSLGRLTLKLDLDAKESGAVKTIGRLGPSRDIPPHTRMRDHIDAAEAEQILEHTELIREYFHWLNEIDVAADIKQHQARPVRDRQEGGSG